MYPNSNILSDADFLYFHCSLSTIQKERLWFHQLSTSVYRCDQSEIMTNKEHKKSRFVQLQAEESSLHPLTLFGLERTTVL